MISFHIVVMVIWTCTVRAQDDDKPIIYKTGFDVRPSHVIPTSRFLKDDGYGNGLTLCKMASFHLKYEFQLSPNSREGQLYPHTCQGIGIPYNTFGNWQEAGDPWTAYVFQSSCVAKISSRLSFDYEWSFGASFDWHPYDNNNSYRSKIIGSKINAYINLGFSLNAKLSRYCNLLVGANLTHYSDGNTHLLNTGLNMIGNRTRLACAPNPIEESHHEMGTAYSLPANQLHLSSSWQHVSHDVIPYDATHAKGVMLDDEAHIPPGHFGILGFNLDPVYKLNRLLKVDISLGGQHDESADIYSGKIAQVGEEPRFYRPLLHEQIGIGLSVRGESTMSFFLVNIGVGHNLFYNKDDLKGLYQIPVLKVSAIRNLSLHVGYQLHKFHNPNNLMLGIEYRFHD